MSRWFGPVRQNGYLVEDLEAAARHWAAHPGTITELIALDDAMRGLFDMIRDAGAGWDGRDPIRRIG